MPPREVTDTYRALLQSWNERSADGYAQLFTEDGSLVGFDGSTVEGATSIERHIAGIFADHETASYVHKVKEIREIGSGIVLLRAIAGMIPAGRDDINPDANTIQTLVVVETPAGWRIAHFHNTPAVFHGRPEEAKALSEELRAELVERRR